MSDLSSDKKIREMRQAQEFYIEHLPFYLRPDFNSCYGHKLYHWQKEFILNRKPLAFLTAANQVGKSTGQILRFVNQAIRRDLWSYWFPRRNPRTFIYLYPEAKLANLEFNEKWVKEYLPRGRMKDDPVYGWKENKEKGFIESITFASGVTCYFRNYSQAPTSIQAATADAVGLDEETPLAHYDELMVRTQGRQNLGSGYVSMVFTATLGQQYLYNCMEMQGTPDETFKGAWKRQISAFDCLYYADGSESEIWTKKYIEQDLMPRYSSDAEIKKRIYGRFIKTTGLVFDFDMVRNTEAPGVKNVKDWPIWIGLDFGSGGDYGHSSGIVFVAVSPDFTEARVVWSWSSKKRRMTQGDLLDRFVKVTNGVDHVAHGDWSATDLFELASREGVIINKAEKSHEIGVGLVNTLLKAGRMKILLGDDTGDNMEIVRELQSINEDTPKRKRVDDMADALRYAISLCPLRVTAEPLPKPKKKELIDPRMAFYKGLDRKDDPMMQISDELQAELDEAFSLFEDIL